MPPNFRTAYFGVPPSPSSINARLSPFRVCSSLPTAWNARDSRAANTPSPVSVSLPRSSIARITASNFVEKHTKPAVSRASKGVCPICQDGYSTEECLQITDIAGCCHHIGGTCLKDMLKYHPMEEKKCPLCRTVWIPGDSPASTPPRSPNTLRARLDALLLDVQLSRSRPHRDTQLMNIRRPVPLGQRQKVSSIDSLSDMSISGNEQFRTPSVDIAEITAPSRKRTVPWERERRRQRQLESFYANNHFDPRSSAQPVEPTRSRTLPSETYTAATNAFGPIGNTRTLNPFRSATPETVPSAAATDDYVNTTDTWGGVARAQRQPNARDSELRSASGHVTTETDPRQNNTSSASATVSHAPVHNTYLEANVEMTAAHSNHQLLSTKHWYDTVSHRQRRLDQREELLNARLRNVRNREADVRECENRIKHALELVKRQRDEVEELLRRQKEEWEIFLR